MLDAFQGAFQGAFISASGFVERLVSGATTPAPLILGALILAAGSVAIWNAAAARRADASPAANEGGEVVPLDLTDAMRVRETEAAPRRAA